MKIKMEIINPKSKIENPRLFPAPSRLAFHKREWDIIQKYKSPWQVQKFLRGLAYNWEKNGETLRTFRGVIRRNTAHCLEAVLVAATILEQHGYPPWVLDIESQDNLDHVLFLFKYRGRFGTVARSRDAGLHGRKPLFRTIRQLVLSYADPFVDFTGRMVGYGVADLRTLVKVDWRLSEKNVWAVQKALIAMPHQKIGISNRRYHALHARFIAYKKKFPERPVTFYSNRNLWM
ncbi:MAG TPA: hypothetical protein VG028_01615 [Terriglobia bacterium]|nr:hypothetical protein [Terriglobia bacterium]